MTSKCTNLKSKAHILPCCISQQTKECITKYCIIQSALVGRISTIFEIRPIYLKCLRLASLMRYIGNGATY